MALGQGTQATANYDIAIGYNAIAGATYGISLGYAATISTTGVESIAVGYFASATGAHALCVGASCVANVANGVAIGPGATTNSIAGAVSIGSAASPTSTAHAFALALNSASVIPGSLGVTLNAAAYFLDMFPCLLNSMPSGSQTMTASSCIIQYCVNTQTITLPATSTLQVGYVYTFISIGGIVTLHSSGGNALTNTIGNGAWASVMVQSTSLTTAAAWWQLTGGTVVSG